MNGEENIHHNIDRFREALSRDEVGYGEYDKAWYQLCYDIEELCWYWASSTSICMLPIRCRSAELDKKADDCNKET